MLSKIWHFLRHYWQFSLALLAAIIALPIQAFGPIIIVQWLLGVAALALAIPLVMDMWDDVRTGRYGIDILALTAIVTAVLLHQYWPAIVIVIMLTGGEALEDYAEHRARSELDALLTHAPSQAHVLRGRKVVDIAVADIQPNDRLLIKAGETVPADAVILEGAANFDEGSLTGEGLPQSRQVGNELLSGSINLDGAVTVRALRLASESQYEQIIRLTKNAASHQAPFVRLADRYSIPFTITAYIIAIAAWVIGGHAIRFLEVIVVATPCPLLLAAPIALVSGMSRASKHGILVKNGSALEKLAEAETFAFDKTGTLTRGEPVMADVVAVKPFTKQAVLQLAASLGQGSAHVLAQAVVTEATAKGIKLTKAKHVHEVAGYGLEAIISGKQVLVGNRGLLQNHTVVLPKELKLANIKQTAIFVSQGGELVGIITFEDKLRPETKATLTHLQALGVKHTMMLTGDNLAAAKQTAKLLGIEQVTADALPADKLRAVDAISDRPVAFVGDGVNDAPVLTAADVGIALGARGSAAASESADVIILHDDFSYVGEAVSIAHRTFAIARQSILIGIGLSVFLMVCFASGHFPPLFGAILQELVDIFVIFNALRAHSSKAGRLA